MQSIYFWLDQKNPNNPTQNYHHQKTHTQHLPPSAPPVSYFHVTMMKGAEVEVKEYCDMLRLPFLQLQSILCFLLNFLLFYPFYTINFSSFGSVTCQLTYHLISEFFTDVSARGALPFPLGCRFCFNRLYWWFPWQKSETTWKRMCTSLFPCKAVFV